MGGSSGNTPRGSSPRGSSPRGGKSSTRSASAGSARRAGRPPKLSTPVRSRPSTTTGRHSSPQWSIGTCSHRHSGTSPCKQCKQPVRKPAFVQAERELCEIEQHMAAALIPLSASVSRIHHSLGDHASGAVQLAAEVPNPLLLCALLLSTADDPDERLPQQPARRWQARHTTMARRCR